MSILGGVLLGQVLGAFQSDEAIANATYAVRSEASREADDGEWADFQTTDIQEWLTAPEERDFTPVDTPAFTSGVYDPVGEWNGRD